MVALNVEPLQVIQDFIDQARAVFAEFGLTVEVDGDMRAFKDFYLNIESKRRLNYPSPLDPDISDVSTGYWLKLLRRPNPEVEDETEADRIVGCVAQRLIETDDFIQSMLSFRAFRDRVPTLDWFDTEFTEEAKALKISGRVVFCGALWLHPDYRGDAGHRLMILVRMQRALAIRHYEPDYLVGWLKGHRIEQAASDNGAAYDHVVNISERLWAPHIFAGDEPKDVPVIMGYSSTDEKLGRLRRELDAERRRRLSLHSRPHLQAAS